MNIDVSTQVVSLQPVNDRATSSQTQEYSPTYLRHFNGSDASILKVLKDSDATVFKVQIQIQ
jgi:hypothetical protein